MRGLVPGEIVVKLREDPYQVISKEFSRTYVNSVLNTHAYIYILCRPIFCHPDKGCLICIGFPRHAQMHDLF